MPRKKIAQQTDERQRLLRENAFHKRMNEDILCSLRSIYKEITQLAENSPAGSGKGEENAAAIFYEASRQLEEVMGTTLRAAENIMNMAEALQDNTEAIRIKLRALAVEEEELRPLLERNADHVNVIVEALSFQDLAGQRIKKVVATLGRIRQTVVQTYVSAGLMLKKNEEEPGKDLEAIIEESKKQAESTMAQGSKLLGPTTGSSQEAVDDLLAKLGF